MSRASRALKTTGRIIKLIVALVIGLVIGLLAWRLMEDRTPKNLATLTPNAEICRIYRENDGNLTLLTSEQGTITRGTNNAGYFSVLEDVMIPEANQIQLLFRYNNSTVRALAEDYDLDEIPSRDEELFDVTLVLAIDKTPENKDDNLYREENKDEAARFVRVPAKAVVASESTQLYNYRRLVFDLDECGEDLQELLDSELLLTILVDVYYNEDIDYDTKPYGALCIYDFITQAEPVKLTKHDRKAIEAFGG